MHRYLALGIVPSLDEDVWRPYAWIAELVVLEIGKLGVAQRLGGVAARLAQPVLVESLTMKSRASPSLSGHSVTSTLRAPAVRSARTRP